MNKAKAEYLPIDKLQPFEGHPFKVTDDEEMNQLVWSILTQGLLTPLVVRPLPTGKYEVISGHRRLHACKKAGIDTVPALVTNMDRDAAAIALVDSNLHREHILPSEKAFAYKLKMDALNRQGTSRQLGEKFLDGSGRPFSVCRQRPFRWAGYAPDEGCCPPERWPQHPDPGW